MTGRPGTVVFDLDGVVYLDSAGVPGAADAMDALGRDGWQVLFATNNSTKTPEMVARHVRERTGYEASADQAVTSTMAAVSHLRRGHHASVLVVGPPALRESLADAGIVVVAHPEDLPDAVVVGLDRDFTYDAIDRAARAVRGGAAFVATNTDPTYPTPSGLSPGAGSIVAAIAAAAGSQPTSCGKPSEIFADLVRDKLMGGPVWVVGDRPDTDVALAKVNGWGSILVLSGVTTDPGSIRQDLLPDAVLASIAEVPAFLEAVTRRPDEG